MCKCLLLSESSHFFSQENSAEEKNNTCKVTIIVTDFTDMSVLSLVRGYFGLFESVGKTGIVSRRNGKLSQTLNRSLKEAATPKRTLLSQKIDGCSTGHGRGRNQR